MMGSARRGLIGKAASKAIALLRLTRRRFDLFAITLISLTQPRVERLIPIVLLQAATLPN